jgi:glucosamine-6-phosphate deaminase
MEYSSHRNLRYDHATVQIYASKLEASRAAASAAASVLRTTICEMGGARIVVAAGNSQQDVIYTLARTPDIDWSKIEAFHMDEYVGMSPTHPASFRGWMKTHLNNVAHPGKVHYLNGDAQDLEEERSRYEKLLRSAPINICFLGIGENGHIAFNDPHEADFHDPLGVKRVELDAKCRSQQVGEGHFSNLDAVPHEAITITCPALLAADYLICCVPEVRKAEAVRNALEGEISTACPASIVRTHPRALIYLDRESASLLSLKQIESPDSGVLL